MRFVASRNVIVAAAFLLAFLPTSLPLPSREAIFPVQNSSDYDTSSWPPETNTSLSISPRQNNRPEWLRIMPLGASITAGQGATPMNGYRKPLRDHLRSLGYKVNMVGSQSNGDMRDQQHEGWPGFRIAQVNGKIDASSDTKPNIYLINAGTNDCQQIDRTMDGVKDDVRDLVLKAWEKSTRATIILSTVLPSFNEGKAPGARARGVGLNSEIRQLVNTLRRDGRRIVLADMDDGFLKESDLGGDGVHPTKDGYRKVAAVWAAAIDAARSQNLLQDPENTGLSDDAGNQDNTCDKVPGRADGPHRIQNGYGFDDGSYHHASEQDTFIPLYFWTAREHKADFGKRFQFAQLINTGGVQNPKAALDDLVWWDWPIFNGPLKIHIMPNFGDQWGFLDQLIVDGPFFCTSGDIRWADWNGDFLDDILCVESNGWVSVGINAGSSDGVRPDFVNEGFDQPSTEGWEGRQVRIALVFDMAGLYPLDFVANSSISDVDGDGRADYCVISNDGEIHCWRNGGFGNTSSYWQDMGIVFNAVGKPGPEIRLVDINGDGRADWIWVGDRGQTDIYTNLRGPGPGVMGSKSMKPYWLRAESGHAGQAEEGVRDLIKFGRVFVKDVSGRRDYVYIKVVQGENAIQWTPQVWRNEGAGGTKRRSDANRYGDMTGEGRDDYLQVYSNGDIYMFGNVGKMGSWKDRGIIYNIGPVDRRFVHIADWDGDGFADIIIVDRANGAISIHHNTYDGLGGPITFEWYGTRTDFSCYKQGWTLGLFDLAVRFADIDGDGRDDYLCMDQDGRTEAILNTKDGPKGIGQIKASETYDRENHRFVDVNGDGRADFLWIEKFAGNTYVWYNQGQRGDADRPRLKGSIFEWTEEGILYFGQDRGPNEYFMDYDGDGRADLVRVNPSDNIGEVYLNKCPTATGGDDPNMDPTLPSYNAGNEGTCSSVSIDLCAIIARFCDDFYLPQDDQPVEDAARTSSTSALVRRTDDLRKTLLANGALMLIVFIQYPRWQELLGLRRDHPNQGVSDSLFVFNELGCYDPDNPLDPNDPPLPPFEIIRMPSTQEAQDPNALLPFPRNRPPQVEHTIDRQTMLEFPTAATTGKLASGEPRPGDLNPIPSSFFARDGAFVAINPALLDEPPVNPSGYSNDRHIDRVMECFGTDNNPYPLLFCDAEINGAKGRVMRLHQPFDLVWIISNATIAAQSSDPADADRLFVFFRVVIALFQYMGNTEFSLRFNTVRNNVRRELILAEQYTRQADLVRWYNVWSDDYFNQVGVRARAWFNQALGEARRPFLQIVNDPNLPNPPLWDLVDVVLRSFENTVNGPGFFQLPPDDQAGPSKKIKTLSVNATSDVEDTTIVSRSVRLMG